MGGTGERGITAWGNRSPPSAAASQQVSLTASLTHGLGGSSRALWPSAGSHSELFWKILFFSYDHQGLSSLYHINCFSATFCLSITRHSDASFPVILTRKLEEEVEVG